ncbi:group XIIB secretory phospholipase A2-like protein isoform X3 [Bubalus kerabau]|uniref:group XIIB secretory phospholipase A2-like protein isoform X3 n=1 Tax=Bubalus carabanensis TaxID=3119969 RepID=UPI00244E8152|nr:group XIIB secretory phospholipase A2-like protein isoform X3 [Bubalus carabanensis]
MVMAPPPPHDPAVSPCFHGCLAFLHRHFPAQSPSLHPPPTRYPHLSLQGQQRPSPWYCSTISKLQLPAVTPSRVPASLSVMDLGIPAMTKCCNQLDVCYETCGANKYRCDAKFRWCLHSICSDLKRSLGFVSNVEVACDSLADTVFNTVWTLGCRPFMNSQRAACVCAEEEKEEL